MSDATSAMPPPDENRIRQPTVETHLLRSRHVKQTYKIEVALPPRRVSETARLPVVYITDGNLGFRMFKEMSCMLQMLGIHPFPAFILVGISYPSDLQFAGLHLRARDLTPPLLAIHDVDPSTCNEAIPIEGMLLPEEGAPPLGGAEPFRQFIEHELIPFIDEHYETIPGDRTYFGHSGGGLFGLFTLLTEPQLFKSYVLSSPSFVINGEVGGVRFDDLDCAMPLVEAFIASGKRLSGIKLYMSIGTEEDFQPGYYESFRLTASFYRTAGRLKNAAIPGLELMIESFPGEVHMTAYPLAFIHGVQAVFGLRRVGGLY
jgi:predicted alpha/beta superfamily hydrolase